MDTGEDQSVIVESKEAFSFEGGIFTCYHKNCDDETYVLDAVDSAYCSACKLWICDEHRGIYTRCPGCRGHLMYDDDETYDEYLHNSRRFDYESGKELGDNSRNFCHYISYPRGYMSSLCGKDPGDYSGALCCGVWTCIKHKGEKKFCDRCGRKLMYTTSY